MLLVDKAPVSDVFELMEFLSYLVTVIGLPLGIAVYFYEQRKERLNEEEDIYQQLSDEYMDFQRLALDNADLKLFRREASREPLTDEQLERKGILFGILISLFERSYLLVYEQDMGRKQQRLWQSWEDYMREWCLREDFRSLLPDLLRGEDPDFCQHIQRIASEVRPASRDSGRGGFGGT